MHRRGSQAAPAARRSLSSAAPSWHSSLWPPCCWPGRRACALPCPCPGAQPAQVLFSSFDLKHQHKKQRNQTFRFGSNIPRQ